MRTALIALVALSGGAAWSAAVVGSTGRALPYHFPRGIEACFGRVYGEAFLKTHPGHRVSELYVYRAFASGPPTEAAALTRAQRVAADRASRDDMSVTVLARFRDAAGAYARSVQCTNGVTGAFCFANCEGAHFDMYPAGRGLVLDSDSKLGFVHLNGACGGVGSGTSQWLNLKKDGVDFRLDPMPIASCLAAHRHVAKVD